MKKSRVLAVLFVVPFFMLLSLEAKACPLGRKEDHLTIQRVMLNFGKFVGQADHVVVVGAKLPNETVTEADISDAIEKIELAQSCAQAVIDKPEGDLLPSKVYFLEGEAKKEYIEDFIYFMTEFRDALASYKDSFAQLAAQSPAKRNWLALYEESRKLNDLIDHSHRKTSRQRATMALRRNYSMSFASLKQNMKQIEKNLKVIAAALEDASKNQENAALAEQTAGLFQATYEQIPEVISDLPDSRQQEAMRGYQQEIKRGIDLCLQLREALLGNDKALSLQILKALSQLKDEGHDQYNP